MAITEDVQLIVNSHSVKAAKRDEITQLENIIEVMKTAKSSIPDENDMSMAFSSGREQMNNLNDGSRQQVNKNVPVGAQIINYREN